MNTPRVRAQIVPWLSVASCTLGVLTWGACSTETPREVFARAPAGSSGGRASLGGSASSLGGQASAMGGIGAGESSGGSGGTLGEGGGDSVPAEGGSADQPARGGAAGADGAPDAGEAPSYDCGPAPLSNAPFTRAALRAAAADCAIWHHCRFAGEAARLEYFAHQLAEQASVDRLERARDAWRSAMTLWSQLELFQFGPLASNSDAAGKDSYQGQGLREAIYSWPVVARCRVEDQLISQRYSSNGFDNVLISSRGLAGLEYLLFYPGSDSACAASSATAKGWAMLDESAVEQRKLDYLSALSSDVLVRAQNLVTLWDPRSGNFRASFVTAQGYPNEQEAMIVLGYALIYAERELKDWKLGIPAGYTSAPAPTETPFALQATQNIQANLRGFRSIFQGCGADGEGIGFDDWLISLGDPQHDALAQEVVEAWQHAQRVADDFPPFEQASAAELETLYRAVKALTDLLKNDLFGNGSPLGLKLPAGVASDTD